MLRRPVGDDAATREQRDARGERLGLFEVVRRQQDRPASGGVSPEFAPDASSRLDVQAGRRLVEEDGERPAGKCERDGEAPSLAAREAADLPASTLVEPEPGK
jgi:hypothetical protein